MTIEQLWDEHNRTRFPAGCRARDIDGVDFVVVDADIAGCVSTFLKRKRTLDPWRIAVLGMCYRNARYLLPHLEPEPRAYFERLEQLAAAVLGELVRSTRAQ